MEVKTACALNVQKRTMYMVLCGKRTKLTDAKPYKMTDYTRLNIIQQLHEFLKRLFLCQMCKSNIVQYNTIYFLHIQTLF